MNHGRESLLAVAIWAFPIWGVSVLRCVRARLWWRGRRRPGSGIHILDPPAFSLPCQHFPISPLRVGRGLRKLTNPPRSSHSAAYLCCRRAYHPPSTLLTRGRFPAVWVMQRSDSSNGLLVVWLNPTLRQSRSCAAFSQGANSAYRCAFVACGDNTDVEAPTMRQMPAQ